MSSDSEQIIVLAEASPNWSKRHKKYLVCTAGVTLKHEWRRLYPMPLKAIMGNIHRWDVIEVKTSKPSRDPRTESRKIYPDSIKVVGRITDRKERRDLLNELSEISLKIPTLEKRSLTLIKPEIIDFSIEERDKKDKQLTLNGHVFETRPYWEAGLYYKWKCPTYCETCARRPHHMECFDWGANILWKRYRDNKDEAKEKVTEMCFYKMKEKYDSWFALGTHSEWPFSKWMIISLLWMKKAT